MKKFSASFKALWIGEIVSEFGGAAGGIINGLFLYELTGSREWMGAMWLFYFIPSILLQGISSPFLNYVIKEKILKRIQLLRAGAYLLPLIGYLIGTDIGTMLALIVLQCILGLLQPIYASLSFSILPDICKEKELLEANGLLDGTIRLMSFLAPGLTSLVLIFTPMQYIYFLSAGMFFISYLSLSKVDSQNVKRIKIWEKKLWWSELKEGFLTFFNYSKLIPFTILSSIVQFAVGVTMVINIPFIRSELDGQYWEYAIFSGSFPAGYAIGILFLFKLPKSVPIMYIGLIGGGISFILLFFVNSIPLAWLCELLGGVLFPIFNAQSAALFQIEAPRERLSQLSAVRLLFIRITMPLGIVFATTNFLGLSIRQTYLIIGLLIFLPGIVYMIKSLSNSESNNIETKSQKIN